MKSNLGVSRNIGDDKCKIHFFVDFRIQGNADFAKINRLSYLTQAMQRVVRAFRENAPLCYMGAGA